MMKYVLASQSPRRSELLKELIDEFEIIPASTEEIIDDTLSIYEAVEKVALEKALDVGLKRPDKLTIAADTIVYCNQKILLKPVDFDDAFSILKLLSENEQEVITGVAICKGDRCESLYDVTKIKFKNMDDEWIKNYIEENQPYDKSGSYGIQEIDQHYIKSIKGDITNVIGLPVNKTKKLISNFLEANK